MKDITLITILVLASNCLVAQNYLNESSTWKEINISFGSVIFNFTIKLSGDTVINNTVYHKTRVSRTSTLASINDTTYYTYPIREETGVFYYYINQEERILHNFNLSIGDTVVSEYPNENITVVDIDTIYIGNIPRKRFSLDHYDSQFYYNSPLYLIEGIGYLSGLFRQPSNLPVSDSELYLLCFAQEGQYISVQPDNILQTLNTQGVQPDCGSLVSIGGLETVDFQFRITPNPAQNHVDIAFDKILPNNTYLQITSIDGKILFQKNMANMQQINQLDISSLPDGVFVISVVGDNILHSKRMIKMK